MDVGMHVGHDKSVAENVSQVAEAILNIIESAPDREVAVKALDTFGHIFQISGLTISNCTIGDGRPFIENGI